MFFLAKYNTQTTFTFPIVKRGVVDLAATADWTPATGDTKISKDAGSVANTTNNPAAVAGTGSVNWSIVLTAAELSAGVIDVQIVDSATKAVEDQFFKIYTYGNASAKIPVDLSDTVRMGLTGLPNVAAGATGGLPLGVDASGRVDMLKINGTSQTARDIGASVLLSTGTGTGQLDFTSGVVKANLAQILGTALTETAGLLAGGFKKFFNIATPASTMDVLARVTLTDAVTTYTGNTKQTGDAFARLGAPNGATISADILAIDNFVDDMATAAEIGVEVQNAGAIRSSTAQAGGATSITLDASASAVNDFYKNTFVVLTGGTGAGQSRLITGYVGATKVATVAAWATNPDVTTTFRIMPFDSITASGGLDAAGVRAAVGLASANLDTQLGDIPTNAELATSQAAADDATLAQIALVKAQTDLLPSDPADQSLIIAATNAITAAIAALNNLSAAGVRAAVGLATANLDTQLDALPTNTELTAAFAAGDDAVLAQVALVKAKTDNLPTDPADHSLVIDATNAIIAAVAALNNLSAAGVRAAIGLATANLDTQLDALPTNTELAIAFGTGDDAILAQVALVKVQTDKLTFTAANIVDANIQQINDVPVTGDGSSTPFGV